MSNENDVSPPEQQEPAKQESNETAQPQDTAQQPQPEDQELEQQVDQGSEKAMKVLAGMMPWVISALFHVGLFLILVFLVFITVPKSDPDEIIIPSDVLSPDPGGKMSKSSSKVKTSSSSASKSRRKVNRKTSKVTTDTAVTKTALTLIGAQGAPSASSGAVGLKSAGSGAGSGSTFFGVRGGNVHNIVYVIDGSGSMTLSGALRFVREEMYSSIGRLSDKQAFNIILFTNGKPVQFQSRLVRADRKNKKKAADFLSSYTGAGQSNPVQALEKAFRCFRGARKKGKLIYLLSDGGFGGAGQGISNATVIAKIRQLNPNKKVLITTFLFGSDKAADIKVMKDIAEQNGGTFKRIDWGE